MDVFLRVLLAVSIMFPLGGILPAQALAQTTGSLTGTVSELSTRRPIAGAQVDIPAASRGGLSNAQGRFLITNLAPGEHTVRVQTLGYVAISRTVMVQAGAATDLEFLLEQTALDLLGVVVTGVAAATPQVELAFTVERLDFSRELAVVPISPEGLLQGRIAGATVVRGSGQPGEDADIMLRGATSISGSQNPLIIIDGVITSGSLSDVNPQDIASVEVVKGAAAASLYGSRAQAGVINITTKRGTDLQDQTRYILRSQYAANDLPHPIPRMTHHYYKMTADGRQYARADGSPVQMLSQRILDDGGDGRNANRAFAVNPFPVEGVHAEGFQDVVKQFFSPGSQSSTYGAIEGRQGPVNYRMSASTGREEGIVRFHDGTRNKSFRLNIDQQLSTDLLVSFSGYYANVEQDLIPQGGAGVLQNLATMSPTSNLLETDSNGDLRPAVGPPGEAMQNLLFQIQSQEDTRRRDRYTGGLQARYSPLSWLTVEGNISFDRSSVDQRSYLAKGTKRAETPSGDLIEPDPGHFSRSESLVDEMNRSLTVSVNRMLGEFTSRSQLRYLSERRGEEFWSGGGSQFAVNGVPRLSLLEGTRELDSYYNKTVAEGFFAVTSLGYQSKYLVDLLGRRDGSSLFGANERWQNYYRVSGAWRASQEPWWPISWLTEFKPRYSMGTAGGRPRYEAQYQTYAVDRGQISPRILGNANLKPEFATEHEFGLDFVVGQRLSATFNFVDTTIKDQLLLTPLPGYFGFTAQWRNAGTLESRTIEASLEAAIIERPNLVWTSFLNFDRTTQVVSKLDVPNFQIRHYRSTMYVVEGEPLGVYYGKKWARACSDLRAGANCGDFDVNDEGYLVFVGAGNTWRDGRAENLWGTVGESGGQVYPWGIPQAAQPWPEVSKMGQSMPDFALGWGQSLRWRNAAVNLLFQGEFGPEIYSGILQWQANAASSNKSHEQAGKPEEEWKPLGYYFTFYDVNINNDHWVRDGSYVKLRELSVRYTFQQNQLQRLFGGSFSPQQATINLVGRNLKTWTSYEGYDPEVGRSDFLGSAVVGRIDEQSYPNFRSFGIDFEIIF